MKKAVMKERIKTLERLLCPDGHTFTKQGILVDGTGNGDEEFFATGFCKVCHMKMTVKE